VLSEAARQNEPIEIGSQPKEPQKQGCGKNLSYFGDSK
jgi:hypothetical protein